MMSNIGNRKGAKNYCSGDRRLSSVIHPILLVEYLNELSRLMIRQASLLILLSVIVRISSYISTFHSSLHIELRKSFSRSKFYVIETSNPFEDVNETPALQTALYYESLKDHLAQINEHNSYTMVKNSIDSILKLDSQKHIPEKYWYAILDSCLRRKSDLFALDVFKEMVRLNVPCTSHQLTGLLILISEKVSYEECLQYFDAALSVGLEPTVHNFSPLLKSCGSARRARQILARMQLSRIEPNVISFSAAIKSCEQTGDWKSSVEVTFDSFALFDMLYIEYVFVVIGTHAGVWCATK
jgi:hypothetical protein